MTKAVALLAAALILALFVACGDDDDGGETSPTGEPTPDISTTPSSAAAPTGSENCGDLDLEATYVLSEGAVGHQFLTFQLNTTRRQCALASAPSLVWLDRGGGALDLEFATNVECSDDNTDYSTCIYPDEIDLPPPGAGLPVGAVEAAKVVVSVANIGVLEPCASPSLLATALEFELPNAGGGVLAELPQDIELRSCSPQVTLWGYGPLFAGERSTSEIMWEEAVALLQACTVTGVMQSHSLDIWITLDDGTERHTLEPAIDDIFAAIDELEPGCRLTSLATE